jgi:predicted nuclease of predicted toxin-antitoxin system
VRFLLDAQLPSKLGKRIQESGHEFEHTLALEFGNRTDDADICRIADKTEAVVVTKDSGFRLSHQLQGTPKRLLLIAIGNCSNSDLAHYVTQALDTVAAALAEPGMVEIRRECLIITPSDI